MFVWIGGRGHGQRAQLKVVGGGNRETVAGSKLDGPLLMAPSIGLEVDTRGARAGPAGRFKWEHSVLLDPLISCRCN
jgi:hypothetical protein